jgi:uncharacterized protein (DUF952 family)
VIAQCYLSEDNDTKNTIHFDERTIVIRSRGAVNRFDLKTPTVLAIEDKKLMLPLIFGGLGACFLLLMLWHNLFDPTPILVMFMASLVGVYFGWQGSTMLIVYQNGNPFSLPLRTKTENLQKFTDFFNDYQKGFQNKLIYHIAYKPDWEAQVSELSFFAESLNSEGFIHAVEKHQINGVLQRFFDEAENLIILEINALLLEKPLKYESATNTSELYPHIYGKINKTAVQRVLPLDSTIDFKIEILENYEP